MSVPPYTKLQVMEVISALPMESREIWRHWEAHYAGPARVPQANLDALLNRLIASGLAEQDTSGRISLTPVGIEELHQLRVARKAGEPDNG